MAVACGKGRGATKATGPALVGRYNIHQGVALLVEDGVASQGKGGGQVGGMLDPGAEGAMSLGVALERWTGRKVG